MIEIENVYEILTKSYLQPRPHGRLYHIVISNTKSTSARDLTFRLTNHFFNRVHRELRKTNFYLNYLFVLEYPKAVSLPMRRIESVDLHAHATINTNIPYLQLGKVLDNCSTPQFSDHWLSLFPLTLSVPYENKKEKIFISFQG
jgi:hypothetical protein